MSRPYKRYFISLKQEAQGAPSPREAFGRCVIEARGSEGKLALALQNVEPGKKYKLLLISASHGSEACEELFVFRADGRGRAEHEHLFDASWLFNGMGVEALGAIAVVSEDNVQDVFMSGYKDLYINFRHLLGKKPSREAKPAAEPKPKTEPKFELKPEPKPEPVSEPEHEPELEPEYEPEPEPAHEPEPEPEPEPAHEPEPEPEPKLEPEALQKKSFGEVVKDFHDEMESIVSIDSAEDIPFCEDIFRTFPPEQPFSRQSKEVDWVRINLTDIPKLPIDEFDAEQNEFVRTRYDRYKHLIFGRYLVMGEPNYILGIPDAYNIDDRYKAYELGFRQFKPSANELLRNGVQGYWLMLE